MAKGGARARSGPPPDPDSLTQADGEWTILPAAGRVGEAPGWPGAVPDPTERELALWSDEWSRPQAVMWERQRQEVEVALYVRSVMAAAATGAPTNTRTIVRQQAEALGISIPGMLRNRWRIGEVEPAEVDEVETGGSSRDRLRVVGGGA